MKSKIDWNEIVPRLSKKKRDDLYLEAVAMLSDEPPEVEPGRVRSRVKSRRYWDDNGDGGRLATPGRKYRLNRNNRHKWREGTAIAALATAAFKQKGDEITYEQLLTLSQECGFGNPQSAVNHLWARRAIDVINA